MVATPRGRLDPNAWRSAPDLEPSEGEQDERYDERTDRVLASDVSGARLEPREKRGKATHWNQPVRGGDGKEQDAKKPGDQGQGSVHRADVRPLRRLWQLISGGRGGDDLRARRRVQRGLLSRRYPAKPRPAKPSSIMAQVEASGMMAEGKRVAAMLAA
jgi:hypothetical protein